MSVMNTILTMAALAGGAYVVVTYVLPYLQQNPPQFPTAEASSYVDPYSESVISDDLMDLDDPLLEDLTGSDDESEILDELLKTAGLDDEDEDEEDEDDDDDGKPGIIYCIVT